MAGVLPFSFRFLFHIPPLSTTLPKSSKAAHWNIQPAPEARTFSRRSDVSRKGAITFTANLRIGWQMMAANHSFSTFQWICMAGIGRSVHLGALTTGAL